MIAYVLFKISYLNDVIVVCTFKKFQHSGVPLKLKRLAREPERFIWAVSIAQSRRINIQMRIVSLVQDADMLVPYAGNV